MRHCTGTTMCRASEKKCVKPTQTCSRHGRTVSPRQEVVRKLQILLSEVSLILSFLCGGASAHFPAVHSTSVLQQRALSGELLGHTNTK
jgi:hypothetical protein